MDQPNEAQWIVVNCILKYLLGTSNYVVLYTAGISKRALRAFRTRRSTSDVVAACRQCNCMIKPTATGGGISTKADFIVAIEGPKSCFG